MTQLKTMTQLSDSMREFLNGRYVATLATLNEDGSIHLTPVWYLFADECFFVATAADDRKVRNILARPQASLVVDSRGKPGADRMVSAAGTAEIIRGERSTEISAKIMPRYVTKAGLEDPTVGPAFAAACEVTISLRPQSWRSWELMSLDEPFFGGLLGQTPEKWFLPVD
jgi:PPOX class probable F420-dependent enzyme